jgi:hypothetical protein
VATQSPYDLLNFPHVRTYLMSFGTSIHVIEVVRAVLRGDQFALGQLPIDLSEV